MHIRQSPVGKFRARVDTRTRSIGRKEQCRKKSKYDNADIFMKSRVASAGSYHAEPPPSSPLLLSLSFPFSSFLSFAHSLLHLSLSLSLSPPLRWPLVTSIPAGDARKRIMKRKASFYDVLTPLLYMQLILGSWCTWCRVDCSRCRRRSTIPCR